MADEIVCPVCGHPAEARHERDEPVKNPETGKDLGWARRIATFEHLDGVKHRVPIGAVFQKP